MSRTDQLYIPMREAGRGQVHSPPGPSNPRHPPLQQQQQPNGRNAGVGGQAAGGSQYVLRLESPQKSRKKRSSLFDGHISDDDTEAPAPRLGGRPSASRNVRPARDRRVENENPHSVLSDFAKNIRASQDELEGMNRTIEEKKSQLQEAQNNATEIVVQIGKLKHQAEHGEEETHEREEATRRLEEAVAGALSVRMEELARARQEVSGDIRTGHATLGQLEARVSAEITVMVEQLEAVISEHQSAIAQLEEELAAVTLEEEQCAVDTQAVMLRDQAADMELSKLREQIQDTETKIEAAGQEVSKAEAERVALLRSIEEEHAINTRLKAQGEESQRKDKEELKAMDAEVKRARDRIEREVTPQLKAEQEKVASEEENLKEVQDDLERTKQRTEEYQESIDRTTEEIKGLDEEMQSTEKRIAELRAEIEACEQEKKKMDALHQQHQDEWSALSDEYDLRRDEAGRAKAEVIEARSRLNERVREIRQELQRRISEVNDSNAVLEQSLKQAHDESEELQTSISSLDEAITAADETVRRLRGELEKTQELHKTLVAEQTEQRALLIQEIQEVEDGARAAGSQLAELQVLLGAAQKEAEEAEAQSQSMLQRTTELETQLRELQEGNGLAEPDLQHINEEAEKRMSITNKEQDKQHEFEVQQLLATLKVIREEGASKLEAMKSDYENKARTLAEECGKARARVEELKRRLIEQEEQRVREAEEQAQLEAERAKQAEEKRLKKQKQKDEEEAARLEKQKQEEEKQARRRKKEEQAAKLKHKEEAARKKKEKDAAAALKKREREAAKRKKSQKADEEKEEKQAKRTHHKAAEEPESQEHDEGNGTDPLADDDESPMPPPSQRPLRPSIQVLPQMDDDFDTSALEDGFDTSAMDDAPPPSPVKPARRGQSSTSSQHEAPRSQRESDASMDLGQEALAAFASTPASQPEGLHRTARAPPARVDAQPQRPGGKQPVRRHTAPIAPASTSNNVEFPQQESSPATSQDPFFRRRSHAFIPDDSAMDTRPGGANPTTTDNPPPPRRSLAEARAAKKAAFSSKANKPQRPVSVSTSRITIEETRTTYETGRGGARPASTGAASSAAVKKPAPAAKRPPPRRSSSLEVGDEWFADDHDHYDF